MRKILVQQQLQSMFGLFGMRNHLNPSKNYHTGIFTPHLHGSICRKQATHLSDAKADPRVELDISPHPPQHGSMDVNGILCLNAYELGRFKERLTVIFSCDHPEGNPLKISPDPGVVFRPVFPKWLVDGGWFIK